VPLSPEGAQRLLTLTSELALWNRSYNLTAITDPQEMLTRHLPTASPSTPICTARASRTWARAPGFRGCRWRW
jgi:16S rRNA (guanine527-N7)-methyltransferase